MNERLLSLNTPGKNLSSLFNVSRAEACVITISFDLLSAEDQAMFRLGVRLENEEQLMELLQDFES